MWKKITILAFSMTLTGCVSQSSDSQLSALDSADNTKRIMDITILATAIEQYVAERSTELSEISDTAQEISSQGADICQYLVPDYLAQLPADPNLPPYPETVCPEEYATGYFIIKDGESIVVSAPSAVDALLEARR
ncbi:MAG: hypothetical protein WDZ94_02130 [Patescibacteria group bacterium]